MCQLLLWRICDANSGDNSDLHWEELYHTGRQELEEVEQGWAVCCLLSWGTCPNPPTPLSTPPSLGSLRVPWFWGTFSRADRVLGAPRLLCRGRQSSGKGLMPPSGHGQSLGGLCQLPHSLRVPTGSQSSSVPFCRRLVVMGMRCFRWEPRDRTGPVSTRHSPQLDKAGRNRCRLCLLRSMPPRPCWDTALNLQTRIHPASLFLCLPQLWFSHKTFKM